MISMCPKVDTTRTDLNSNHGRIIHQGETIPLKIYIYNKTGLESKVIISICAKGG